MGRDRDCDLVLDADCVSRRHARFRIQGLTLELEDNHSANGSYVNSEKITRSILQPGDRLSFDGRFFEVHFVEGEVADIAATQLRSVAAQHGDKPRVSAGVVAGSAAMTGAIEEPDVGAVVVGDITSSTFSGARRAVLITGLSEAVSGREYRLSKKKNTIGRSPLNDIILPSPAVSSRHAELNYERGQWTLVDCGSSNGTYLNGEPVEEAVLEAGDILGFGNVEFEFDAMGRPLEPAATRQSSRLRWRLFATVSAALIISAILFWIV